MSPRSPVLGKFCCLLYVQVETKLQIQASSKGPLKPSMFSLPRRIMSEAGQDSETKVEILRVDLG